MAPIDEVRPLEELLLALGPACNRSCAESLLAPGFREFGGSGRMLDREAVLRDIANAPARTYHLSDMRCIALSVDTVLLTYRVVVNGCGSIRSSLWVLRGHWQMLFHQGTPVPAAEVVVYRAAGAGVAGAG